jgi:hypothetical protein
MKIILRKTTKKKTQIKVLKLIKRTNIGQSQHPLSVLLQSIIEASIYQFSLWVFIIGTIFLSLLGHK